MDKTQEERSYEHVKYFASWWNFCMELAKIFDVFNIERETLMKIKILSRCLLIKEDGIIFHSW